MTTIPDTESQPSTPRLAATLLLVRDDPFEILMVRRPSRGTFASALAFPGGAIEPDDSDDGWLPFVTGADDLDVDERAQRIGVIRETWEETSILLAKRPDGAELAIAGDVAAMPFREVVEQSGGLLALADIVPFSHWVTPEQEKRRFDTRFYLAAAPVGQDAIADGGETVTVEWMEPSVLVDRAAAGDRSILFPTLMNLQRLAQSSDAAAAGLAAKSRPLVSVRPFIRFEPDGTRIVVIPIEAGYGITEYGFPASS